MRTHAIGWAIAVMLVATMLPACVSAQEVPGDLGVRKGLCVIVDAKGDAAAGIVKALGERGEYTIYVQVADADALKRLQDSLAADGTLAKSVFPAKGDPGAIHLATNLADVAIVAEGTNVPQAELLRVLRPGGKAFAGGRTTEKPGPEGLDDWSHPYHDPSNNPQSTDRLARAPYLTQYLSGPMFGCQPCVTVAAGGRLFRAYGHMAFTSYQNEVLQTLYVTSAYNGTLLWKRRLAPGFMIQRDTVIATGNRLYLGDDTSCKVLDAATGELVDEIAPPVDIAGGTVWKWMALVGGKIYALTGGEEVKADGRPARATYFGGWGWAMWPGYDYKGGERAWGFGRDLLCIDPATKEVLWRHHQDELIDGRAVCMRDGRIYFYSPGRHLACMDASNGSILWKNSDADLLAAIGPDTPAQNPRTGFTPSAYMKCNERYILFAGPQRARMVAASTKAGRLLWQNEKSGNYQLVLRDDAIYAAGHPSAIFAYDDGKLVKQFRARHNCTRATGSVDGVFFRGPNGTTRYIPDTGAEQHIALIRPPCQDGVVIADGLLHWGPWICGCKLSLFGHMTLTGAGDFDFGRKADEATQLETFAADAANVKPLDGKPGDWPVYRADNARTCITATAVPAKTRLAWTWKPPTDAITTAPVTAGGLVFVADTRGSVRALDASSGDLKWTARTEGGIYYPPAVSDGRAYVGSNDGHVWAMEAATGRALWRFRVAPVDRRIMFYDAVASTWPVAGGVVVEDGVLYAAAGIDHLDGTHVCALDAVTGKIKWHNNSSGNIHPDLANGISLMGNLRLEGDTLSFPGGNAYPVATYDVRTGQCLNKPGGPWGATRSLFYPREAWGVHESIIEKATLNPPTGVVTLEKGKISFTPTDDAAKKGCVPWAGAVGGTCRALACAGDAVLVAYNGQGGATLAALDLREGKPIWSQSLPGDAVVWGLAVDATGRVIVTLEDGRVVCYVPAETNN